MHEIQQIRGTGRSAWKRNVEKLVLPSGNDMVCKKPDMVSLVMSSGNGVIPDGLFAQVAASLEGKEMSDEKYVPTKEEYPKLGAFIELVVRTCCVSPRIVDNLSLTISDDELLYDELDGADRMFIFNWAMPREVAAARTFPQTPVTGVDVSPDLQSLQLEPSD